MIRVVVVDSDVARRHRLAGLLRGAAGLDEVTTADTAPDLPVPKPDVQVILLALDVAGVDLPRVARRHFPGAGMRGGPIAVLTREDDHDRLRLALYSGFRGMVFDTSPVEEVVTAVRAVAAGYPFIPAALLNDVALAMLPLAVRLEELRGDPRASDTTLTAREQEVLALLAIGCPNEEIADKLVITEATVRSHVLKILRKLGVRNRTEAVFVAHQRGLFGPLPYAQRGVDSADGVPVRL
ncbi:MAG: response regulator transcription factor [Nonomuraea sp.]|nr:response regulator transcription factor [Nonomuraea sp.]